MAKVVVTLAGGKVGLVDLADYLAVTALEEGDGIYTCEMCNTPLDENDDCPNVGCQLHPANGGFSNKWPKVEEYNGPWEF